MIILLTCLFIATLMPILAKIPLAVAMNREQGGYNNRNPRQQQTTLSGFEARAKAAHENCFEALIMFTPGALAVLATANIGPWVEAIAISFIVVRVLYLFAYYYDQHLIRSVCWAVGFFASLALIVLAFP